MLVKRLVDKMAVRRQMTRTTVQWRDSSPTSATHLKDDIRKEVEAMMPT